MSAEGYAPSDSVDTVADRTSFRQTDPGEHRTEILLAGAVPGAASGNAVSSEVLSAALGEIGHVAHLSHRISGAPYYLERANASGPLVELGTQPFTIHGEALLPGLIHRRRFRAWECAWAVNSRYAGSLLSAHLPYAIWEATVTSDELKTTSVAEARRNGRGNGMGVALHSVLLPLGRRLEGLLYRRAVILCAMSPHTRDRIIKTHGIKSDSVLLLPHPPSLSFLSALENARRRVKPRSTQRAAPLRLLFVGRVDDPRKSVQDLLYATCRVRSSGTQIELTIAGPVGDIWRARFAEALQLAGVRLLGPIGMDQLVEEYLSHDAFVLPSRQEGFGIVVAEAFHAGLPVISTRCGGPEDFIVKSEAGLLVDHGEVSIAAAIETLASNDGLRMRCAANAFRYAAAELSFSIFAGRVRSLTDDLVREGRSSEARGKNRSA